jgi:acyl transferase domain-containing protein
MLRNLQMLSPDSTSKPFDHKANGFARGEGLLAFVLKPLSVAIQDGDMIRAVVRAVASNQDGHTPLLSQPNPVAQEKLIRFVYAQAGLGFEQTRYVEAHGTGTPVGDPIEMKAIGNVFRDSRSEKEPLYVYVCESTPRFSFMYSN